MNNDFHVQSECPPSSGFWARVGNKLIWQDVAAIDTVIEERVLDPETGDFVGVYDRKTFSTREPTPTEFIRWHKARLMDAARLYRGALPTFDDIPPPHQKIGTFGEHDVYQGPTFRMSCKTRRIG